MKKSKGLKGVFGILGVLIFSLTDIAFADLTKQDIEEIRKIVKEEVQREIQHVNKRIDGMENSLNKRIDSIENNLNRRIDDIANLLYVILAGMFALVGFVLWDRRTALAPAECCKI